MASDSRPNERLVLLIEQLVSEYTDRNDGKPRGALPAVAKQIDLSLSYVRKLAAGERTNVTVEQIDKVRAKMRLPWSFFTSPEEQHYSDAQRRSEGELTPGYREFREVYRRFSELSEEQQRQLENLKFRGGPPADAGPYVDIAQKMLGGVEDAPVRKAEVEAKAQRLGVKKFR